MTFTFTSKETYLAFRADWKQRYFAQIKVVRAAKLGIREANRAYAFATGSISDIWEAYRTLRAAHEIAQELLVERWEAAAEAGRQMQNTAR